jgi:hypothetical protein
MGATGRWGSRSTGGNAGHPIGRVPEMSCSWWGRQQQLREQMRGGQTHGPAQSSTTQETRQQTTQVGHADAEGQERGWQSRDKRGSIGAKSRGKS